MSCHNGREVDVPEGAPRQENNAEFVKRLAGDRVVFAAKDSFYLVDIELKQAYPFEVTVHRSDGTDITWRQ
jgi:hypothetical protein